MKKDLGRIFTTRTYAIYRHQRERAEEWSSKLPYGVDDLRRLVKDVLGQPCPYCSDPIDRETLSVDHATPISREGEFSLTNLVVSCTRCNQVKGNMTASEYGQLLSVVLNLAHEAARSVLSRLRAGTRFYK